jgi:hypothetical protein
VPPACEWSFDAVTRPDAADVIGSGEALVEVCLMMSGREPFPGPPEWPPWENLADLYRAVS